MLATYFKTLSFNILVLTRFLNTILIKILMLTLTFKISIIAKRLKRT